MAKTDKLKRRILTWGGGEGVVVERIKHITTTTKDESGSEIISTGVGKKNAEVEQGLYKERNRK